MKTIHQWVIGLALGASLIISAPQSAQAADNARIGMPQKTGPFQITLLVEPKEAQVGENRFRVDLTRDGHPVADAKVTLTLTRPLHRHSSRQQPSPRIETQLFASGAAYACFVHLDSTGPWQARIRVQSGEQKGSASYSFSAGKAAPHHLGMQHPAGPFQVVLTTAPDAPTVGNNRFRVLVLRDGKPVTEATVNLGLAQPLMSRPEPSLYVALKAAKSRAGLYEGTASLPQTGDWEARINIQMGTHWARTLFQFKVAQNP